MGWHQLAVAYSRGGLLFLINLIIPIALCGVDYDEDWIVSYFSAWSATAIYLAIQWWDTWSWIGWKSVTVLLLLFSLFLISISIMKTIDVRRAKRYLIANDLQDINKARSQNDDATDSLHENEG